MSKLRTAMVKTTLEDAPAWVSARVRHLFLPESSLWISGRPYDSFLILGLEMSVGEAGAEVVTLEVGGSANLLAQPQTPSPTNPRVEVTFVPPGVHDLTPGTAIPVLCTSPNQAFLFVLKGEARVALVHTEGRA